MNVSVILESDLPQFLSTASIGSLEHSIGVLPISCMLREMHPS